MYKTSLIALATIASGVVAQTTTTLFLAGFDDSENLVGSIIGSDASATTYSITCASDSDIATDSGCEVPDSFTFTQGPSTINYLYTISDSDDGSVETAGLGCNLSGSSSAACSASYLMVNGTSTVSNYATTTTITADLADMTSGLGGIAVTITAGAAASTTNTAASTTMSSSTTGSGSTAKSTGKSSTTGASQTAATGTATTSSSTGGVPMITGNARWVVGGVAAVGLVFGL